MFADQFLLQNIMAEYSLDDMLIEQIGSIDPSLLDFDFSM
jgi:hypothetical protein